MGTKQKEQVKIIKYWRAFESFVMPSIEHNKTPTGIEQRPIILQANTSLPWPLPRNIVESKKEGSRFVFNVYVGLIEQTIIKDKIQQILKATAVDYDLRRDRALTCLAGFVLDDKGCLLSESYITPEFVKSLYALEHFDYENGWATSYESSKRNFETMGEIFSVQQGSMLTFDDMAEHLKKLMTQFDCICEGEIKFPVIIHIKKIAAPMKLGKIEINETLDDPEDYKEIEGKVSNDDDDDDDDDDDEFYTQKRKKSTLNIFPSYFIDDLGRVVNSIGKTSCGKALQEYLKGRPSKNRKDVYRDRAASKILVSPRNLPAASWPDSGKHSLSFAQQMAVNVALSKKSGLFSVNGPPGTGKTTLLRDIASDVFVRRAEILTKFEHPLALLRFHEVKKGW